MAEQLAYWQYEPDNSITCPKCGWTDRSGDHENHYRGLLDIRCGACDTMLMIVTYPTLAETRAAAAEGNVRAQRDLPDIEAQAARRERAASLHLRSPDQLPDLPDEPLIILWDFETTADENWQVLRHGDDEIWRELAYYESFERFAEVFEILRQRYGRRLAEVRPTQASELYLYGDRLSSPGVIERLNASLRTDDASNDD